MNNETGEIVYQGAVWKVSSLKDGGWRLTVDLSTGDIPVLRVDDLVAVALLRPDQAPPIL